MLVNTSFNVRGEPIVCTPEDAFRCFMGNELDLLVVGNCVMKKSEQDPRLKLDYSRHSSWIERRFAGPNGERLFRDYRAGGASSAVRTRATISGGVRDSCATSACTCSPVIGSISS